MLKALRQHWVDYLLEALGLGVFVACAGALTILTKHPASPLVGLVDSSLLRRGVLALGMVGVVAAIVYSPAGQRSGAHINPAVTWAFWRMGKIQGADAAWYVIAQFLGAVLAALSLGLVFGSFFSDPSVMYGASVPGPGGDPVAFAAEFVITCGLMLLLLVFSSSKGLKPYLGAAAAALIGVYLLVETPLSGMSLNPARSLASAVAGGPWKGIWLYFLAPTLGAWVAVEIFSQLRRRQLIVEQEASPQRRWRLIGDFCEAPSYPTAPQGDDRQG